jgi:iron complex transport system permease protein
MTSAQVHSTPESPLSKGRSTVFSKSLMMVTGFILLIVVTLASIRFGVANVGTATVLDSIFHYNPSIQEHEIIHDLRLPRVLAAVMIGAAFGIAGSILQTVTQNALAAPEIIGINWGAALMVLITLLYFPSISSIGQAMMTFIGGGVTMALVLGISSFGSKGITPIKLALAGVTISALMGTLIEGLIIIHSENAYALSYLLKGSIAGVEWKEIKFLYPWIVAGVIASFALTGKLNVLKLGVETATGLGLRVRRIQFLSFLTVIILVGSSIAVSGPIAFVGLVVPNIARILFGTDERWLIPGSALIGGLLLVSADLATRLLFAPEEVSISILMSLVGAIFFIYLIRSRKIR